VWTLPVLLVLLGAAGPAPPLARAECAGESGGVSLCIYRSFVPSTGIVSSCRDDRSCQVGYYYGKPSDAVWFKAPSGLETLPRPEVVWLTAALAQVRFDCASGCSWSYFFEVTRRRLSEPRRAVLAADPRRLLVAMAEGRTLVLRQMFSGREVGRVERDWAPADWLGDAITALHFDPDGRLSLSWLRGADRAPVTERISVPSIPR
jgi:hypothetical protein